LEKQQLLLDGALSATVDSWNELEPLAKHIKGARRTTFLRCAVNAGRHHLSTFTH